jgi:hypothetical protein
MYEKISVLPNILKQKLFNLHENLLVLELMPIFAEKKRTTQK